MKTRIIILSLIGLLFAACNRVEEKAQVELQKAKEAFSKNLFAEAKERIDSIKIKYPKAFNTRHEALQLLMDVELKEQETLWNQLDSLLRTKQDEFARMKPKYTFEKDSEYQNIGHYLMPQQEIEKNLHRSFLRFMVDEKGKMSMTSIYCGGTNIHHTAVKVTAADETFAQTPVSKDSYETSDMGEKIEKADFLWGEDGNVIQFISEHKNQVLTLLYLGDRNYTTTIPVQDKEAAFEMLKLATLLSSIEETIKAREAAGVKIKFIEKMKEQKKKKE